MALYVAKEKMNNSQTYRFAKNKKRFKTFKDCYTPKFPGIFTVAAVSEAPASSQIHSWNQFICPCELSNEIALFCLSICFSGEYN